MLTFLYGQDTYRSRQKLNKIIDQYKETHKRALRLTYFDFDKKEGASFEDLKDEIQSVSMFKEKKLVVLKNAFSNSDFKEKFLENSKKFIDSKDTILFFEEGNISLQDKLFKFLAKNSKLQEFKLLESQKLKSWTKEEFEKQKANIDSRAVDDLLYFVGNDLWQMSNEIRKLTSFAGAKRIEREDVRILVKPRIENDIFRTIDALAAKNKKQAISLLHKHLENGDSPLYLLSMIHFQFKNILIIKSFIESRKPYSFILKKSGLHPFVVKKSYSQAKEFTLPELKKIYQKIFQADLNIKTGKMEATAALNMLITEI